MLTTHLPILPINQSKFNTMAVIAAVGPTININGAPININITHMKGGIASTRAGRIIEQGTTMKILALRCHPPLPITITNQATTKTIMGTAITITMIVIEDMMLAITMSGIKDMMLATTMSVIEDMNAAVTTIVMKDTTVAAITMIIMEDTIIANVSMIRTTMVVDIAVMGMIEDTMLIAEDIGIMTAMIGIKRVLVAITVVPNPIVNLHLNPVATNVLTADTILRKKVNQ